MGWLIALGVILLIALTPVAVHARYDAQGGKVVLWWGFFHRTLYPNRKPKKEKKSKQARAATASGEKEKNKGGSVKDFFPLIRTGLDFLGELRRRLRITRLEINIILGGDDPCDLAVSYGKTWTAIGNLMPHLERLFVIKKREIQAQCDFTAERSHVFARAHIRLTTGRVLCLAVKYGVRALKQFMKLRNERKGGASK